MNKAMIKVFSLIATLVIGFIAGVAVDFTWDKFNKVDTNDILLFLRYPDNFVYNNGKTYIEVNGSKFVDERTPIPFNISLNLKNEQSLVLGLQNNNPKPIDDIMFRLILPEQFQVTRHEYWIHNGNGEYYTKLGNINSGVGHNTIKPIDFIVKETDKYPVIYAVSGRNFTAFNKTIIFDVYDKK